MWCIAEQGALSEALTQSCVERYERTKDARFLLPAIPGMQRPAVLQVCACLRCAALCCMLCCAVLCCAVLCCAVLCTLGTDYPGGCGLCAFTFMLACSISCANPCAILTAVDPAMQKEYLSNKKSTGTYTGIPQRLACRLDRAPIVLMFTVELRY